MLVLRLVLWATAAAAAMQNASIVSIPQHLIYYLPASNFSSELTYQWTNGTTSTNQSIDALLERAARAAFISYSDEFLSIIGDSPSMYKIHCPSTAPDPSNCAFESGVWISETNEVWFSASTYGIPDLIEGVTVFNLNNESSYKLQTDLPIYPNGGYLFRDKVWFGSPATGGGNPASVFSVDVQTGHVEPLINSYFGIPFPGCDEPVWVTRGEDKYLFFTGLNIEYSLKGTSQGDLPNAVWRYDPQNDYLQPVVDRTTVNKPNGVRVTQDQQTLYVTDSGEIDITGGANGTSATSVPGIYKFDLNEDAYPVNGRLWGLARTGIADGLHIDDAGRVWSGEGGGVVVRNSRGKVLGEFNANALPIPTGNLLANFALAGDKLVIGVFDLVVVIQLNETVIAENSTIVN